MCGLGVAHRSRTILTVHCVFTACWWWLLHTVQSDIYILENNFGDPRTRRLSINRLGRANLVTRECVAYRTDQVHKSTALLHGDVLGRVTSSPAGPTPCAGPENNIRTELLCPSFHQGLFSREDRGQHETHLTTALDVDITSTGFHGIYQDPGQAGVWS